MKRIKRFGIPEQVIIGGRDWKIVCDPTVDGGEFSESKSMILIGTMYGQEAAHQILLHEVIEGIFASRLMRYKLGYNIQENGHLMFVFDHNAYEEAVKDIYLALRDMLHG